MGLGKKYLELVNNLEQKIKEIMISDLMNFIADNEQFTLVVIREKSE